MLDNDKEKQLDEYIRSFMHQHQIPGLVVMLGQGESTLYGKAFGSRDLERGLPTSLDTIFGIASVTKSFTALSIAQLVDKGLLSFDDPVIKHLPEFKLPGCGDNGVTVRHLLSHTSGLPPLDALQISFDGHSSRDPGGFISAPMESVPINTYADLIAYVASYPGKPLGEPGEYFNYSNEGYALLGAIVRKATGIPYAAFVRRNILQPLDMYRTTYSFEEMYEHNDVTVLYDDASEGELHSSTRWPCAPGFQASGRLKSSGHELLRFFKMLAGYGLYEGLRYVSPESFKEIIAPRFRYALHEDYAHALIVRPDYHGVTLIGHGGEGKGASAYAGFIPETGHSAVVLCNYSGIPAIQVFGAVINVALGLAIDTPRTQYTVSDWHADQLDLYSGTYASADGTEMTIARRDTAMILLYNHREHCVRRITNDVGLFDANGHKRELRFYRDSEGKSIALGYDVRFIPRHIPSIGKQPCNAV